MGIKTLEFGNWNGIGNLKSKLPLLIIIATVNQCEISQMEMM